MKQEEMLETRKIMYELLGKSITYSSLLVGVSQALQEPRQYQTLVLLGVLAALGRGISQTLYNNTRYGVKKELEARLENVSERRSK